MTTPSIDRLSGTSSAAPPRRSFVARVVLLVLLAVGPLLPTVRAPFVYDDTTIIRDNVLLRGWSAIAHVWSQPYWPSEGVDALGLYRPFHMALLAGMWNLTNGSARWMHVYALVLAALATLGVWWMLRRGVGAGAAFVGAAWFATQPLHVEAIASIANSSELLMVICTSALVWAIGSTEPTPADARRDWWRALGIGLLAAAAIGAKESGLFAVPLAALTVWGWRQADRPEVLASFARRNTRAWLAALVGVSAVLMARVVVLGAPVSHASIAAQGLSDLSGPDRVVVMLSLWPRIVGMLSWPTALSPFYGPSIFPAHRVGLAVLSLTIVIALAAICVVMARRGDRRPLVALAWVVLTYFPASNLLEATGQILSDRTLFGATVGVAFALAWGLNRLPQFGRRLAMVIIAIVVGRAMLVGTHYAIAWTSHRSLWQRLAESQPNEHLSYKLLGMDARARGDTLRAMELLERAFAMAPKDRQLRFEVGQAQYSAGRFGPAANTLAPLLKDGDARGEPGFVALYLDAVGRAAGPEAVVRAASPLMHSETAPVAALFLGVAMEQLGRPAAADSAYAAGLTHSPADSALLSRRAALYRGAETHH
ncbi:MAG: tetratricopeptide repeat protein [Gemmatimonadaceae bacterium]